MKFVAALFLIFLLIFSCDVTAQVKNNTQKPASTNQTDSKGLRTGLWWIVQPENMGEDGYTEFGHYDHGNKTGRWYKMDNAGDLVSIEAYKSNVLNGEVKYFEKGKLTCIGHYRGLNPGSAFDTIVIVDPNSGYEHIKALPAENGTQRHGLWQYYDPQTGKLQREEEYQVDNLIYHKDYGSVGIDSVAYLQHIKNLPHNKHTKTHQPKEFSYIYN